MNHINISVYYSIKLLGRSEIYIYTGHYRTLTKIKKNREEFWEYNGGKRETKNQKEKKIRCNWEEKKKRRGKREEEREIEVKTEKLSYFVSLFNIGPYDRQQTRQKTGKNFNKFQGGGNFSGGHNIYPWRDIYP